MKKAMLVIPFLVAFPLLSQDFAISLSYGQSKTVAHGYFSSAIDDSHSAQYSSATLPGVEVQLAWVASTFGPFSFELTGSYLFPSTIDLTDENTWGFLSGSGKATGTAHFRESHVAAGGRLAGRKLFDWSLGIEYRRESLRLENGFENTHSYNNFAKINTSQVRPWIKASVGYTFPGVFTKPFVAATWALALTQTDPNGTFDSTLLKSLAPKTMFAIQVGVHF